MSNYKLMPEKATPEMEQAAEKYWNQRRFKGLSDDPRTWAGVYQAMRAVAPTVQAEPVGWQFYEDGKWWNGDDRIKDHRKNTEEAGYLVRDVYATPQPAEQQPINHDWDDQDKCRRCGDRDWCASATCSPKQQPTTDVAALVEALEGALAELEDYAVCFDGERGSCRDIAELEADNELPDCVKDARAALAAHRKKGGKYEIRFSRSSLRRCRHIRLRLRLGQVICREVDQEGAG